MSKGEFDTFELNGQEFVVPALQNDAYRGYLIPWSYPVPPAFSDDLQTVFKTDEVHIAQFQDELDDGSKLSVKLAEKEKTNNKNLIVVQNAIYAEVTPPEGPLYEPEIFEQFGEIRKRIEAQPVVDNDELTVSLKIDEVANFLEKITPRTSEFTLEYPFIHDSKGIRVNPTMLITQALRGNVYKWLPGPIRVRNGSEKLDPTYNPRPLPILSLCSIRITLINQHIAKS